MSRNQPFWETDLDKAIAEVMAKGIHAQKGIHAPALEEPLAGLIEAVGCRPEYREQGRMALVRRLNQDPLNLAAKERLPEDWRGLEDTLYILQLLFWGIWEEGIVGDLSNWQRNPDAAAGTVLEMMTWNPAYVMALLTNPENPENCHLEGSLCAEDLEESADAHAAAWRLMEQLVAALSELRWDN